LPNARLQRLNGLGCFRRDHAKLADNRRRRRSHVHEDNCRSVIACQGKRNWQSCLRLSGKVRGTKNAREHDNLR
jgi:hypothetical protein